MSEFSKKKIIKNQVIDLAGFNKLINLIKKYNDDKETNKIKDFII